MPVISEAKMSRFLPTPGWKNYHHYLVEHPGEAKKMGANARKAVLEKYNWEAESKKLLDLYGQVISD